MFYADLILQAAATGLLLYGLYEMGNNKLRGPLLAGVSELLWVAVGISHDILGLVVLSVILTVMQGRNFAKWYRDKAAW